MVVITAGRAFDRSPGFARVGGAIRCRVNVISAVRICGIDCNLAEVPAPPPKAALGSSPASRWLRHHRRYRCHPSRSDWGRRALHPQHAEGRRVPGSSTTRPEAIGITGRNGDADFADEIIDRKATGQLLPGIAAVGGLVEATARHVGRRRRQTRVDGAWPIEMHTRHADSSDRWPRRLRLHCWGLTL